MTTQRKLAANFGASYSRARRLEHVVDWGYWPHVPYRYGNDRRVRRIRRRAARRLQRHRAEIRASMAPAMARLTEAFRQIKVTLEPWQERIAESLLAWRGGLQASAGTHGGVR